MANRLKLKEGFDLKDYNTMQVSAKAAYFVEVHTLSELKEAVSFGEANNLELLVLGGGSNILFKANFNGLVILNSIRGMSFTSKGDFIHEVKASSGENWHDLVLFCVKKGLAGIENLSLIPGSVGAAPIQNIGAYGVELQDVFLSLEAMMVSTGEIKSFSKEECNFGYRDSIFKNELKGKAIITSVTIQLSTNAKPNTSYKSLSDLLAKKGISNPSIKDVSEAVIEIRKSKLPDPKEIGNTGSFFKNPIISVDHFNQLKSQYPEIPSYPVTERQVKVPAGWLIDKDGWKGKREGEAGVHEKQALVLVNHGNASGKEIWNLASQIRLSIEKRFNISLTPEVNIIG